MKKKNIHTTYRKNEDKWAVKKEGNKKASGLYDTKKEAEIEAKKLAQKEKSESVIHDKDGKISDKDSYGIADEKRFAHLVAKWKEDTLLSSDVQDMISHPAYLEIVAMGRSALPLLLKEMATAPDHWSPALVGISGENPVPAEACGDLTAIAKAWETWGRQVVSHDSKKPKDKVH